MDHTHILGAIALAGALLIVPVNAGAVSPAGLSRIQGLSLIEFVQDKQKPETVKHAAKRIWRNLTGYKFDVACLFTRTTCTETGKNREDARAKCQGRQCPQKLSFSLNDFL
jgi:hypothetical protein